MTAQSLAVAYRIATERLVIRCWRPQDAALRRAALDESDSYLRPWIPFMRLEPRSLAETAADLRLQRANFDRDIEYRYGIFSPDEQSLIGETGLYPRAGEQARELGYGIGEPDAGRGFATEAAAAMVRVGFEVSGVRRLELLCSPDNPPSAAVARKLGFAHEATLRERFADTEGEWRDSMVWTLFAEQYPASPSAGFAVSASDCLGRKLL